MMLRCNRRITAALARALRLPLVLLMLSGLAMPAYADSVDELRALVEAGDTKTAWEMAQRMEAESSGDPDFDFWYGMAAREAGQRSKAVLAFERVVMAQPGNPRAKLELADAYAKYGNTEMARSLFEEVLATTPPDPVQQRIRLYLGALGAAEQQVRIKTTGYVTLSGGHDTNVNNATSTVEHEIGALTFTLLPQSLETEAGYMDVKAGLDVVQPVSQRHLRFLSVTAQARDNEDILSGGNYDYLQASVTGGWLLQRGAARWRIPLNLQALSVESDETRYMGTAGVEWNRPYSASSAYSLFGQAGMNKYPSAPERTATIGVAGAAWSWNAPRSGFRLTTTLQYGIESVDDADYDENSRQYLGLRCSVRYAVNARHSVYGAAGIQQSNFDGVHPVLLFKREELLGDASLGWQWQIDKAWSMNSDVLFARNDSQDNELYDYSRTQYAVGVTRRF